MNYRFKGRKKSAMGSPGQRRVKGEVSAEDNTELTLIFSQEVRLFPGIN